MDSWYRQLASKRPPDFIVGTPGQPYMLRWWVIPRNKLFNIYLHKFLRSDDDEALHDHPWLNMSYLLEGSYIEHTKAGSAHRFAGDAKFRFAHTPHRIEIDKPCWSLFVTGPIIRQWGFHCPSGWKHWKAFTTAKKNGTSLGCG